MYELLVERCRRFFMREDVLLWCLVVQVLVYWSVAFALAFESRFVAYQRF